MNIRSLVIIFQDSCFAFLGKSLSHVNFEERYLAIIYLARYVLI